MSNLSRGHYLEAMGITQWVLKGAECHYVLSQRSVVLVVPAKLSTSEHELLQKILQACQQSWQVFSSAESPLQPGQTVIRLGEGEVPSLQHMLQHRDAKAKFWKLLKPLVT